jgi:hypothetical protein
VYLYKKTGPIIGPKMLQNAARLIAVFKVPSSFHCSRLGQASIPLLYLMITRLYELLLCRSHNRRGEGDRCYPFSENDVRGRGAWLADDHASSVQLILLQGLKLHCAKEVPRVGVGVGFGLCRAACGFRIPGVGVLYIQFNTCLDTGHGIPSYGNR